ncbi:MAG: RagB/SusD family nutrient uptake outer membrane protein, partial [Odoribacteraceae bacterium]|nr:RagB/SusD family nutrient uptake outer membrane protein [Odoribacteraceae bacterium]
TARDLIERANNPEQRFFPLTAAGLSGIVNDRVFSQELLFTLYNVSRRQQVYNTYFSSGLPIAKIFGMTGNTSSGRASFMFDDENDYRFKMLVPRVIDATELTVSMKYEEATLDAASITGMYRNLIPLARLSEAYLIAAECEENVQDALDKYINPLRLARNSRNLTASTPAELTSLLFAEYTREFIGEGQLFFYFKRRALLSIPNGTRPNTMQTKTIAIYAFPVPDSETYPRAE